MDRKRKKVSQIYYQTLNFRYFGKEDGDYNFSKYNISEIDEKIKDLEEEQDSLSKKININCIIK
jgi:hypothetical protein